MRDTAIVRVFIDTGVRRAELTNLKVTNLDLLAGLAYVLGDGRRERVVPFGAKTATALDRYLRRRRSHSAAGTEWLWLGAKGRLTESGIAQVLNRRARAAGLGRVHPHQLRHTWAHAWLAPAAARRT